MTSFRPYQTEIKHAIHAAWNEGHRNVAAVLPTGGGKTVVFSDFLLNEPAASVAIAHRSELVSQMSLALARNGVRHRIIGPDTLRRECSQLHMLELRCDFVDPRARCAAAGVDTLVRLDPTKDAWFDQVRLWVCDEAHHLLRENKWGRAVAMFPNARGLGVTATLCRADGKGLGRTADGVLDTVVVGPTGRQLMDLGYLTRYKVFAPASDVDLSGVPLSANGDYSPQKLAAAVHDSHIVGDVVQEYQRITPGKLGVTFAVDIDHAVKIAQAFRAAGVPAEVVTGKTPTLARQAILRRFRQREILQLVNVDLFGEGFDLPAIEVVCMARPTQSFSLFCQQFGRALRILDGKTTAYIIDHVGNVERHARMRGLPDGPQSWTLERRESRGRGETPDDVIPVRTCTNIPEGQDYPCGFTYARTEPMCPECEHVHVPMRRDAPEHVDGVLHELDLAVLAAMNQEVARIDGAPRIPWGLSGAAQINVQNQHILRQQAQGRLRAAIDLWAGYHSGLGRDLTERFKRFYFTFGIDTLSACALGTGDADVLCARIDAKLAVDGVVNNTENDQTGGTKK